MNVLSIAYPFAPVGPRTVGGAEQILTDLDEALVTAGMGSLVIACEGSQVHGQLFTIPLPQGALPDERSKPACHQQVQRAIDAALTSHTVDLVHLHGLDFDAYTLPANVPVVVTLHMPLAWYPADAFAAYGAQASFVSVSESQKASCPLPLAHARVIPNGVALAPYEALPRENFALALGRVCPEKNLHEALVAGKRAGMPVYIGGQIFPYPEHERYFTECVEPLLTASRSSPQHAFLGPLSPERKQQLLARARCFLHPTLAPETSSLVAMEALAAGTPVIAYRSGALPEIVEDGVTGFLVNNVSEMAEAIGRVDSLSRAACRAAAEQHFSKERMTRRYLELYADVVARGTVHRHADRMRVELFRTTAELEAFAPQWQELWQRDVNATPFQSPAWMLPWWHQFGQAETRVTVVVADGGPVAMLPFYIYPEPETRERKLLLIGAGTTDYLDGLFAPTCTSEHVQFGMRAVQEAGGWDTLAALQMRPASLLYRTLCAVAGASSFASESCSRMPASAMAALPVKIRRNAMYYRNRALRMGELRFRVADATDCLVIFETLQTLHTQRWQARGESGVLADERVLAMHREAIPRMQADGTLRLCALQLGEQTLGVLYSLIDPPGRRERTQYFYLTAFSSEHAELRPGTLLLAYAIEHAAQEGVVTIDMLRGDEAYKAIWHTVRVPTYGVQCSAGWGVVEHE